jgi:hypothetical protein
MVDLVVMRLIAGRILAVLSLTTLVIAGGGSRAPRGGDWVAGDGAYPVHLPGGRVAWLFGDSLIRRSDGGDQLVHSAIVVTSRDGEPITTVHGGTGDHPADLVPLAGPETIGWPSAGFVEGGSLQVFFEEISTARGGFRSTGRRFLVGLSLPDLAVTGRAEIYGGEISWGQALLVRAGDVYVYGNRELDGWTNTTYLARFARGGSHGPWEFWDGGRFQGNPLLAAPLNGPDGAMQVAKLSSVVPLAGKVAAFTIDPYGKTIDMRTAPRPWGPFSARRPVYHLPEASAYLPRAHWDGDHLEVAYSVQNDRPRFVRLRA